MSTAVASSPAQHQGFVEVPHRRLITISIMLASVMQALDVTIANVALPHIQGSMSATQDQMSWVLTSYIIATAIMTPLSGWLAGRFGRRRIIMFSIVGFTCASAMCGISQSLPEIVVARLLQGLCGAALVPMSQAVLLDINPPERHAKAMNIWVMGITVGPILGPALGGWLTENYSWRWVFFINVPVGILCSFAIAAFMHETVKSISRFDFFGFTTLSLAIGGFQMLLDRGQSNDWFSATESWIEATVAFLSLYLFLVHLLTTREKPFLSPALYRDRNYLTGNIFIFIIGVVLFSTLALLPPLLQGLLHYPVVLTGLATAPRGIGTLAAMLVVGQLVGKIDMRYSIFAGLTFTALAQWSMTGFYLQMDTMTVVWSGLLQGFGVGLVFVPLTALAFATLSPSLRNEGTAVFSLARNIGSSIGISVVTTLLTRNTQIMHSRLAEDITPFGDAMDTATAQAISSTAGLAGLDAAVTRQAAMIAYNNDFHLMLLLTLCAVPLVFLLRPAKKNAQPAESVIIE